MRIERNKTIPTFDQEHKRQTKKKTRYIQEDDDDNGQIPNTYTVMAHKSE